jgi:hypothetical protein
MVALDFPDGFAAGRAPHDFGFRYTSSIPFCGAGNDLITVELVAYTTLAFASYPVVIGIPIVGV